jgi:hypothetical protein
LTVREELGPPVKITVVAVLSTLSDLATTRVALRYPENTEANPNVNFEREFLFAETGGIGLYTLAKLFKQPTGVALVFGLVPAVTPFAPALNNLIATIRIHSFYINWDEISLLYREEV